MKNKSVIIAILLIFIFVCSLIGIFCDKEKASFGKDFTKNIDGEINIDQLFTAYDNDYLLKYEEAEARDVFFREEIFDEIWLVSFDIRDGKLYSYEKYCGKEALGEEYREIEAQTLNRLIGLYGEPVEQKKNKVDDDAVNRRTEWGISATWILNDKIVIRMDSINILSISDLLLLRNLPGKVYFIRVSFESID